LYKTISSKQGQWCNFKV